MTTTLAPAPSPLFRAATVQRKFPLLQLLVLIALVVFVGNRDGDYSWADLWAPILLQASFLGIASAGQTLAILVGGLDFSIAAYIVAGNLLTTHLTGLEHWNFGFVAVIVLVICLVCGGASGWVCHRFGLEPLVVTLGMSSVVVGALLGTDTTLVNGAGPGWLQNFTAQSSDTFGLPIPPIVTAWIVLAVVVTVILAKTPLGRKIYLAGPARARPIWPASPPGGCGPACTRPARCWPAWPECCWPGSAPAATPTSATTTCSPAWRR